MGDVHDVVDGVDLQNFEVHLVDEYLPAQDGVLDAVVGENPIGELWIAEGVENVGDLRFVHSNAVHERKEVVDDLLPQLAVLYRGELEVNLNVLLALEEENVLLRLAQVVVCIFSVGIAELYALVAGEDGPVNHLADLRKERLKLRLGVYPYALKASRDYESAREGNRYRLVPQFEGRSRAELKDSVHFYRIPLTIGLARVPEDELPVLDDGVDEVRFIHEHHGLLFREVGSVHKDAPEIEVGQKVRYYARLAAHPLDVVPEVGIKPGVKLLVDEGNRHRFARLEGVDEPCHEVNGFVYLPWVFLHPPPHCLRSKLVYKPLNRFSREVDYRIDVRVVSGVDRKLPCLVQKPRDHMYHPQ